MAIPFKSMHPAQTIRPYLEEFVLDKDQDWSEMLFDLSREKLLSIISLPSHMDRWISRSLEGKMTVRVAGISSGVQLLYAAGHQLIYTVLAIASAGVGIYFHHIGDMELARYAAYGSGGCIALLFLSMIRARRHRRGL